MENLASRIRSLTSSEVVASLGSYLLIGASLCYFTGFLITNISLSYLGVVNFDLLKARYILTGFVFLVFVSTIAYQLFFLFRTLTKFQDDRPLVKLMRISFSSLQSSLVVAFLTIILGIFTGSAGKSDANKSVISQFPISTEYIIGWAIAGLVFVFAISLIIMALLVLAVSLGILLNPRDSTGNRKSRREFTRDLVHKLKLSFVKDTEYYVSYMLLVVVPIVAIAILGALVKDKSAVGLFTSNGGGWNRFLVASIAIYMTLGYLVPSLLNSWSIDKIKLMEPRAFYMFITAIVITAIVFVYTFGVYPYLPLQAGGNKPLPVVVNTSNGTLKSQLSSPNDEIYLIDRSSSTSIFLAVNITSTEQTVIEASSDLIESITFK